MIVIIITDGCILFLPFRTLNRGQYGDMWNRDHIERVEIVLKEQVDVKGDSHVLHFHDNYSVFPQC